MGVLTLGKETNITKRTHTHKNNIKNECECELGLLFRHPKCTGYSHISRDEEREGSENEDDAI